MLPLGIAVFVLTQFNGTVGGAHPTIVPLGALIENVGTDGGGVTRSVWVAMQPTLSLIVIVLTPTAKPVYVAVLGPVPIVPVGAITVV